MASNLTTSGATAAMAALAGSYWLGLGTGQSPAGLVGEANASGTGYARVQHAERDAAGVAWRVFCRR